MALFQDLDSRWENDGGHRLSQRARHKEVADEEEEQEDEEEEEEGREEEEEEGEEAEPVRADMEGKAVETHPLRPRRWRMPPQRT